MTVFQARLLSGSVSRINEEALGALRLSDRIIETARREASLLLKEASIEVSDLREKARKEGFQAGLADATEVLIKARLEGESLRELHFPEIVSLATGLAEKILGAQLDLKPEAITSVAKRALEQVRWCRRIVLRVHPEDMMVLERERITSSVALLSCAHVEIMPDPEITRGGCRVESEAGEVDATLETQLAAMKRALCDWEGSHGER